MQRRDFIKRTAMVSGTMAAAFPAVNARQKIEDKEVYELRVYELRWSQAPLDDYLSKGLFPALNRMGIKKAGAFSETGKSEPAKVYVLIPYPSFGEFGKITLALRSDKDLQRSAADYNKIPPDQAVLSRYQSSLLLAFDGLPVMVLPPPGPRIFELRTYEGYSEDAVTRKIRMFNEGEFEIFNRVKLNPVFFGEMIAGPNLPCLTYMITFKNMEERDKNWKVFSDDPEWARISKDPQYANTVSKIYKTFLAPLPYSQI